MKYFIIFNVFLAQMVQAVVPVLSFNRNENIYISGGRGPGKTYFCKDKPEFQDKTQCYSDRVNVPDAQEFEQLKHELANLRKELSEKELKIKELIMQNQIDNYKHIQTTYVDLIKSEDFKKFINTLIVENNSQLEKKVGN